MNRWTRRSPGLAALTVAGGLALAACGAGQVSQTASQRPTVDGQNGSVGVVALRDVAVEYPAAGVYKKGGDARLRMVVVNGGPSSDTLVSVQTDAAQEVTLAAGTAPNGTPTPTGTVAEPSSTPTGTASGTPTGTAEPASPSVTQGSGSPSDSPGATESGSSESPAPSATPTETASAAPATRITIPGNGYVSFREDGPSIQLVGLTRQLRPAEVVRVTFTFQNAGSITLDLAVSTPEGEVSLAPKVSPGEGAGSEG